MPSQEAFDHVDAIAKHAQQVEAGLIPADSPADCVRPEGDAHLERMKRIMLHAAQVQDGLIPADSPDDFTVPQPLDDKGLPWWFGPDYQPTDEALAEFAKPMTDDTDKQIELFGD